MSHKQSCLIVYLQWFHRLFYVILGVPIAHNAAALVEQYRMKVRSIYDLWVDMRDGEAVTLDELKNVYGAEAYAFNDIILI